jgi:hypothetical protein
VLRPSQPASSIDAAATVLGYLNFSSGAFDPTVWRAMSELFSRVEPDGERSDAAALVAEQLEERLVALAATEPPFRDSRQAAALLELVFDRVLPAYRGFHRDLLEHQPPGALERPFFVMAAAQAVLAAGSPWDDADRIEKAAIASLNDYVGWRPVAVLENNRLSEPYPHERVRPVPLYIAGAGAAHGRYAKLVSGAIDILSRAPRELAAQADFDLERLEELAIDPRAFDFLHPAASRPNYLFGLWDPACIDRHGNYRRMVVQQATLDGILSWSVGDGAIASRDAAGSQEEFGLEASAVLAGVMLMAAGLSGHGPGAYQAALPLSELLPRIAGYRDAFYRWLMTQLPEGHRARLEEEIRRFRQPFGGVRRHINALLATRRARQVESVALASVLARLGRAEGAERMAGMVPAASARMLSRVMSRVVAARREAAVDAKAAIELLDEATDLLFRAVGCGATIDPWSILGLGGQFPLHEPGGESLPDPRVDDLVSMTESILEGYARICRVTALAGERTLSARASGALERLAEWWDRHATDDVSGVPHLSGREVFDSTHEVIAALERRRASGGDVPAPGFWRREVAAFTSTRSHADAVEALLDEGDLDGAMGLLVHWATLLEESLLETSGDDWLEAAARWLVAVRSMPGADARDRERRFLELVDANTSGIGDAIERATASGGRPDASRSGFEGGQHDDESLADDPAGGESVAAAYESMVWQDSADDGVEGGLADTEGGGGDRVEADAFDVVEDGAVFLAGVAGLVRGTVIRWCLPGSAFGPERNEADSLEAERDSVVGWRHSLRRLRRGLVRAAMQVAAGASRPLPGSSPSEYDRARLGRDAAAERLSDAAVQITETLWGFSARLARPGSAAAAPSSPERSPTGKLVAAMLAGDVERTKAALEIVKSRLVGRKVLYVPLSRGGRPDRIVHARCRERLLERIGAGLPRLGLVDETIAIVNLAKSLERNRPKGAASVSEFDRIFEAATTALVERIVESASDSADAATVTTRVLEGLALLVPRLLETWMTHARQLRLSVLERVRDDRAFETIRDFVERYGNGLFTQHILAPGALRGILRGGVRRWIEATIEKAEGSHEAADAERLVDAINAGEIGLKQAAARLRFVFESIAENHAEYRDWNSTTSQSDRGECLHILLDFLRLKAEYDRIAWTLRPVNMAHRVLARRGASDAAAAWRRRMHEETEVTHRGLVERLAALERKHGVRLASIADRVGRPFAAALEQDELEALAAPAVRELLTGEPEGAGAALETRAEQWLGVASGSGVELPEWLERLERVVQASLDGSDHEEDSPAGLPDAIPWKPIPWAELSGQFSKRPA